jgi:hypothetical protein
VQYIVPFLCLDNVSGPGKGKLLLATTVQHDDPACMVKVAVGEKKSKTETTSLYILIGVAKLGYLIRRLPSGRSRCKFSAREQRLCPGGRA